MDRGSKILITITVIFLIASIFFTYYRFFITKDYIVLDNQEIDLSE